MRMRFGILYPSQSLRQELITHKVRTADKVSVTADPSFRSWIGATIRKLYFHLVRQFKRAWCIEAHSLYV